MNYQTAIWSFFWTRCSSILMCLITAPVWTQADDANLISFLPLLIVSTIAIWYSFHVLPKKILKYKGYLNYQIQRVDQYFDKLSDTKNSKYLIIYFTIILIVLWTLKILVLNKWIPNPPNLSGIITMLSALSARMLSDYHQLKIRQKRKNQVQAA
jgi:hypothetical protein